MSTPNYYALENAIAANPCGIDGVMDVIKADQTISAANLPNPTCLAPNEAAKLIRKILESGGLPALYTAEITVNGNRANVADCILSTGLATGTPTGNVQKIEDKVLVPKSKPTLSRLDTFGEPMVTYDILANNATHQLRRSLVLFGDNKDYAMAVSFSLEEILLEDGELGYRILSDSLLSATVEATATTSSILVYAAQVSKSGATESISALGGLEGIPGGFTATVRFREGADEIKLEVNMFSGPRSSYKREEDHRTIQKVFTLDRAENKVRGLELVCTGAPAIRLSWVFPSSGGCRLLAITRLATVSYDSTQDNMARMRIHISSENSDYRTPSSIDREVVAKFEAPLGQIMELAGIEVSDGLIAIPIVTPSGVHMLVSTYKNGTMHILPSYGTSDKNVCILKLETLAAHSLSDLDKPYGYPQWLNYSTPYCYSSSLTDVQNSIINKEIKSSLPQKLCNAFCETMGTVTRRRANWSHVYVKAAKKSKLHPVVTPADAARALSKSVRDTTVFQSAYDLPAISGWFRSFKRDVARWWRRMPMAQSENYRSRIMDERPIVYKHVGSHIVAGIFAGRGSCREDTEETLLNELTDISETLDLLWQPTTTMPAYTL